MSMTDIANGDDGSWSGTILNSMIVLCIRDHEQLGFSG